MQLLPASGTISKNSTQHATKDIRYSIPSFSTEHLLHHLQIVNQKPISLLQLHAVQIATSIMAISNFPKSLLAKLNLL